MGLVQGPKKQIPGHFVLNAGGDVFLLFSLEALFGEFVPDRMEPTEVRHGLAVHTHPRLSLRVHLLFMYVLSAG